MEKLILISFLLLPFGFLSFGLIHQGQQYALILSGLICFGAIQKNIWIKLFFLYLAGWGIFIFVMNLAIHIDPSLIEKMLRTITFFTTGAMIYQAIKSSSIKSELFYNAICIAAIIQSLIAGLQMLGFDPVYEGLSRLIKAQRLLDAKIPLGSLGNPNFLTAFLAISLPFFFRGKWFFGSLLPSVILILGNTSGAFVAAAIGVGVYFRHPFIGLIVGISYLIYDSPYRQTLLGINPDPKDGGPISVIRPDGGIISSPEKDFGRTYYWKTAIMQLIQNPLYVLFGFGPGTGPFRYPLHNEWLESWYQYGVFGFAMLSGYVLTIYRKNRILFSAFVIVCLNMAVNYPLHLGPSAYLIIIIAALIERERQRERQVFSYFEEFRIPKEKRKGKIDG